MQCCWMARACGPGTHSKHRVCAGQPAEALPLSTPPCLPARLPPPQVEQSNEQTVRYGAAGRKL
jgi:hypothetical protein